MELIRRMREPVNGLTHLAGAFTALLGLVALALVARGNSLKLLSLSIYGMTLIAMFSSSAAYHLVHGSPRLSRTLQKLDHSAIFLLIAGTYTPICTYYFTGFWRLGFLIIIWSFALAGICLKLLAGNAPRRLNAAIYLLMGWAAVLAAGEIFSRVPAGAIMWLLLGGLFFTIGAFVYIFKKPDFFPGVFGFHELWHIFVILGAFSHFAVMLGYIAPG
jgi:hemolysin III